MRVGSQQHVAEVAAAKIDTRQIELVLVSVHEHSSHEREAVAVEAARCEPQHDVARRDHRAVDHARAVHRAHAEAGEVVVVLGHDAGVLGHLAAHERAPRLPATLGDARDDRFDARGIELADGDVVEEEQRLGTGHEDVVRAHRHEVDTDRVVAVHELRELELGADAVGARDRVPGRPCPSEPKR